MGYIYKITHKESGHAYIGLTKQETVEKRWNQHMNDHDGNYYFHNALRLYGENSFTWEILIICFDEDLSYYEKEYIKKYNTIRPDGYNLTEGGEKGWKHHPDTVAKIKSSKAGKGNHRTPGFKNSEDTKSKMSVARKVYLDTLSEDEKRRQIEKARLTKSGKPNHKRGIPVVQLKDGIKIAEFPSSAEAGRKTGILYNNINSVCNNGGKKSAGGYTWKFLTDLTP